MLNISENNITEYVQLKDFKSSSMLNRIRIKKLTLWLIVPILVVLLCSLFLPWTQNISAKGYVSTRSPEQRPQSIPSIIGGRIDRWYVQEGDYVAQGDTIAYISEVKSDYFDPALLDRTNEQITAKSKSVNSYSQKVAALNNQYQALGRALELKKEQINIKIAQTLNKITIDSIDLEAYHSNLEIAKNQLSRTQQLYDKGLKSLTDLQDKLYKVQSAQAKVIGQTNKLQNQKNEINNLKVQLASAQQEYADKMSKSISERQSALADQLKSEAETAKLQNKLSNYSKRQQYYFITAPQAGYINKSIKTGIGEILKEGENIVTIMPSQYDLATEIYVRPQDIPLIAVGNKVQLRFDGWPALVISGWPEGSTGLFSGKVVVIDREISKNGKYRILVSPIENKKPWPKQLRIGTGVRAFMLLKEVPIWYEVWRQLNGFPADYYQKEETKTKEIKTKAPLKSVK